MYRISIEKRCVDIKMNGITHATLQLINIRLMIISIKRFCFYFLILTLGFSCENEISIQGFDTQKWKEDPNGCYGAREKLLTSIMSNQSKLIGHNEKEIKKLFGKPDATDIRSRGQKFFEYGIKGGTLCNPESSIQPEILRIRFDALDRVSEVAIY